MRSPPLRGPSAPSPGGSWAPLLREGGEHSGSPCSGVGGGKLRAAEVGVHPRRLPDLELCSASPPWLVCTIA